MRTVPKYVAFLRAINVSTHVVKMDHLRSLFEELGLLGVETFINSGNVIFNSKSRSMAPLEEKIAAHLHAALGYEVDTFIRSLEELEAIAAHQPFPDAELNSAGARLSVGFLSALPSDEVRQRVLSLADPIDELHFHGREIYWLCRAKFLRDSKFSGGLLEKTLRAKTTIRNTSTVKRILSKSTRQESVKPDTAVRKITSA
jgi:uncharacterized protein (DUF1697 family)